MCILKVFKKFSIRSNHDNICDFLSTYMNWFGCPTQLEQHGISCTCSFYTFNTSNINLPPSVFHVKQLDSSLQWLATVSSDVLNRIEVDPKTVFIVKAEMLHGYYIVEYVEERRFSSRHVHGAGILGQSQGCQFIAHLSRRKGA